MIIRPLLAVSFSALSPINVLAEVKSNIVEINKLHDSLSALPPCQGFPTGGLPVEHRDNACNRVEQNDPMSRHQRKLIHNSMSGKQALRIPEERTWICPDEDDMSFLGTQNDQIGTPVHWIVRNAASGPVVLSYVDANRNYQEYSPVHPTIRTPNDPDAILQPGQWMTIRAFQGHVFSARELLLMENGELGRGRVLLIHRPGLVPIRNRSGMALDCSSADALADLPPVEPEDPDDTMLEKRTEENLMEHCNVLHKGFVNKVGCPVDVYWAGSGILQPQDPFNTNETDAVISQDDLEHSYGGPDCNEVFKFHLGLNRDPENYLDDWDSPIAYEGTYLTHRFVARLRHRPSIVVDEVVMTSDFVQDCPSRRSKVKAESKVAIAEAVIQAMEVQVGGKLQADLSNLGNYMVISSNGTEAVHMGKKGILLMQ